MSYKKLDLNMFETKKANLNCFIIKICIDICGVTQIEHIIFLMLVPLMIHVYMFFLDKSINSLFIDYFEKHDTLSSNKSAFHKHHSAVTAFHKLVHDLLKIRSIW